MYKEILDFDQRLQIKDKGIHPNPQCTSYSGLDSLPQPSNSDSKIHLKEIEYLSEWNEAQLSEFKRLMRSFATQTLHVFIEPTCVALHYIY